MDLLTIKHTDFKLYIECGKFDAIYGKAKGNIQEENLTSRYTWSDGVESVSFDGVGEITQGQSAKAMFFDNADYSVWVDFEEGTKNVKYLSARADDNDHFRFRHGVLSGFLNYGNDVGLSEIRFSYELKGERKEFFFGYEVLSTKLDYHSHWKKIIADIEEEYRMLSLDYLRRTCHSFSEGSGDSFDLIWWNVFQSVQAQFIGACKNIIERPRHRLRAHQEYKRADKIRRFTPQLEQEFAEHRREFGHLYVVQEQENSNNTFENRFLKHTLHFIAKKFGDLLNRVKQLNQLSDNQRDEFEKQGKQLSHLMKSPFFRTVGKFEGLRQESLILQNDTNYSKIYRTSILLRKSFSLNEGMYRMETKDIATLYEIWCFIQVSHIVKKLMGDEVKMSHPNRMEMSSTFVYELGKGEHSRILFERDNVQLAELIYNPKNDKTVFRDEESLSIEDLVSPTVPQKPDIVLQLTKNDIDSGMKMTYLFDAKYRIAGKDQGADIPPDDAINQMHRYRDAIYYKRSDDRLRKEVIGGYILFPGAGEKTKVEQSKYYKSIEEVNIGAFPLRPDDGESKDLLVEFIDGLLSKQASTIVREVIPQKGTEIAVHDRVLVGLVKRDVEKFEKGEATIYYTGPKFPTTIPLDNLHLFAPYIKEKGIRDVYEITKIRTITSQEAKGDETKGDDLRLAFELGECKKLFDAYKPHKLNISETFSNTIISKLKSENF